MNAHKECILFIYARRSIHASMQEVMSVWAEYAELQSLTWQWLDQCTKMYLAWCCSSWSQALDADHYKMMILNLRDIFHSNAISRKCNLTKPTHVYDLESISRSCRPPVAEALGRLWGRSFPTLSQIYQLHWYDLCSEGMLYGSPCSMLNAVSWLYCTDPNLHNHLREHVRTRVRIPPSYSWNYETELRMKLWNGIMECCVGW